MFVNLKFILLNTKSYQPIIAVYKTESTKQNHNKCESRIRQARKQQNLPFLAYSGQSDGKLKIREF